MLQQVELASTFFNKFFICCSYYHPRNKFLRNNIWETSSDWTKFALQHRANFITSTKMAAGENELILLDQKLSEAQKYWSSITNRSTSTIVEPQSRSVQTKMFSLVIRPLVLLFWLHWPKHIFFLMYWRTSKNFHADFCPFPSLFTSRTNANRTLCKIIFKLFQEILNLQHRVSIAIASLFLCVCSCDLTWSFPKDMDSF